MKKLLIAGIIGLMSITAQANGYHHGHGHRHGHIHGGHWNWVVPAVIGGTIVYAATRPPVVAQQPVVIQPQPQIQTPAPLGYHYEQILDANCNCYRLVLIPN